MDRSKPQLRTLLRQRRAQAAAANPAAALAVKDLFLSHITLPAQALVSTYVAQADELNPAPLSTFLHARGHALCLPCLEAKQAPLVFRAYAPGDPLAPGHARIPEPLLAAACVTPTVLLVPLLGFDERGNRLGQGGGFYDRTLAQLRKQGKILAIGIAFEAQACVDLPQEAFDEPLDFIVTEKRVIDPAF